MLLEQFSSILRLLQLGYRQLNQNGCRLTLVLAQETPSSSAHLNQEIMTDVQQLVSRLSADKR